MMQPLLAASHPTSRNEKPIPSRCRFFSTLPPCRQYQSVLREPGRAPSAALNSRGAATGCIFWAKGLPSTRKHLLRLVRSPFLSQKKRGAMQGPPETTQMLLRWSDGDQEALGRLLSKKKSPPTSKPTGTFSASGGIAWSCATVTCPNVRCSPEPATDDQKAPRARPA